MKMTILAKLFSQNRPSVIGMIHLLPLPGTPLYKGDVEGIIQQACKETEIYLQHGIDSILVENMHDIPYVQAKHLGPETVAVMTRVCNEVKKLVANKIPLGLQILAGGNKESLAVALATGFNYIRAEGFVFSHIADEGFTDANAGTLLRYRKQIGCDGVKIITDVKKKHSSHSITSDISLIETSKAAEFFLSDGIILTGAATGDPANTEELKDLKSNCNLPVIIGSGITLKNFKHYLMADTFIIGSYFKEEGNWKNGVCPKRVGGFMDAIKELSK